MLSTMIIWYKWLYRSAMIISYPLQYWKHSVSELHVYNLFVLLYPFCSCEDGQFLLLSGQINTICLSV